MTLRSSAARCSICTAYLYAADICPRCSLGGVVALTQRDREILLDALAVYDRDLIDATPDEIDILRALLSGGKP